MDGLGTGCGLARSPRRYQRQQVGSVWGSIKKAGRKVGRAVVKAHSLPLDLTKKALPRQVRAAINQAERIGGRALKRAGKLAASYASPVLAAAAGAGAGAGCALVGVPPMLCAKGGSALGKAAGAALSRKLGVPVRSFPGGFDPAAALSGNPQELLKLGGGLLKQAGVNVPLQPDELLHLVGRKTGLPPEVMAMAQQGLSKARAGGVSL